MYYRVKQLTLILGDLSMLYAGFFIGVYVRYGGQPLPGIVEGLLPHLSFLFVGALSILFIIGLYDIGKNRNTAGFFKKILISAVIWMMLAVIFFYTNTTQNVTPKTTLALVTLFSFGFIALWRALYNQFISTAFLTTKVIFAGAVAETIEVMKLLTSGREHGYEVLGYVSKSAQAELGDLPHHTTINGLIKKVGFPELIVVSPPLTNNQAVLNELYEAIFRQTSVVMLSDFYEQLFGRVPSFIFSESWFITNLREQQKKIYDRLRIFLDYAAAILMGAFFVVTFPLVALAIKLSSRGPVLFRQVRIGRGGQKFTIVKYRTMQALSSDGSAEVAGPEFAKIGDSRVTAVGTLLRRTRIDEIPQFWNILRGEMGLIGPRPERPEFVEQLTQEMPFYTLRHLIKPGLTGWAQVQHSYYGTLSENLLKLQYDLYYVKHRGPLIDLSIALKTINVLARFMGR
jgi:exopolysaccharide biosynthesis polyprenyl glycosylphosphotransferase